MAIVYMILVFLLALTTGGLCQPSRYFYFVDYSFSKVYRIDPDQAQSPRYTVPLSNVGTPTAVGYDEQTEHVYVMNGNLNSYNTSKYLLKYHGNSGGTQRHELRRSTQSTSVAVDSASGLLYYAERVGNVIVALTTDLRYQTIIIDSGLDRPSDIALDTINKAIYWCDWSTNFPHIGKANMDGSSRRNIITHGLYLPYAITLDIPGNKIYWVDHTLNKIDRSDLDGSGRETILSLDRNDPTLFSVAVDHTYVYWVQRLKGAIFKKRKSGGSTERIGTEYPINTTDYRSLRLINTMPPPPQGTNACSGRGGCGQICIPTAQFRVCRCSENYILQPDGTSCQESSFARGIVAINIETRVLVVLDLDTNATKTLTDTWYSNPRGIALDESTFEIFWTDRSRRAIFKTCIPTPCFQTVRTFTQLESHLGDVALDTQKKTIYVGDHGIGRITRISYSGSQEQVIAQGGALLTAEIVIQIALNTKTRMIYWATDTTIEEANMDQGSKRRVLQTGLNIGGLVLDTQTHRLYVLRYDTNDIEVMDLARGTNLQPVYQESGTRDAAGLALGDGKLYFGNRKDGSINELDVATQEVKKFGLKKFNSIFSMVYFSRGPLTPPVTPGTGPGATPDAMPGEQPGATKAPSGGNLLNQTLIIALSVSIGGLVIIVGIIICGVVIYKRTLASIRPASTKPATDIPLSQPPPQKNKPVFVPETTGVYDEIREFPTAPKIRAPIPLPKPPKSERKLRRPKPEESTYRNTDPAYVIPIPSPSVRQPADYEHLGNSRN